MVDVRPSVRPFIRQVVKEKLESVQGDGVTGVTSRRGVGV